MTLRELKDAIAALPDDRQDLPAVCVYYPGDDVTITVTITGVNRDGSLMFDVHETQERQ